MPTICIAVGFSNLKDEAKGISLHVIPFLRRPATRTKEAKEKIG